MQTSPGSQFRVAPGNPAAARRTTHIHSRFTLNSDALAQLANRRARLQIGHLVFKSDGCSGQHVGCLHGLFLEIGCAARGGLKGWSFDPSNRRTVSYCSRKEEEEGEMTAQRAKRAHIDRHE
jgi:hypothetical protein